MVHRLHQNRCLARHLTCLWVSARIVVGICAAGQLREEPCFWWFQSMKTWHATEFCGCHPTERKEKKLALKFWRWEGEKHEHGHKIWVEHQSGKVIIMFIVSVVGLHPARVSSTGDSPEMELWRGACSLGNVTAAVPAHHLTETVCTPIFSVLSDTNRVTYRPRCLREISRRDWVSVYMCLSNILSETQKCRVKGVELMKNPSEALLLTIFVHQNCRDL